MKIIWFSNVLKAGSTRASSDFPAGAGGLLTMQHHAAPIFGNSTDAE